MYYGTEGLGRTWSEWWAGEEEERITDVVANTINKEIQEREQKCRDFCEKERAQYVHQSWVVLTCGFALLGGYLLGKRLQQS